MKQRRKINRSDVTIGELHLWHTRDSQWTSLTGEVLLERWCSMCGKVERQVIISPAKEVIYKWEPIK